MSLENATHCCSIATARHVTGVRLFPCVGAHVSLEMATHSSSIPTTRLIAGVRPFPCVHTQVDFEVIAPFSAIATARGVTDVCGHGKNFVLMLVALRTFFSGECPVL